MLNGRCDVSMGATLAATPYRQPELFDGLNTLDFLELCGSMAAAAGPLNLSQPTVSRRYQKISRDFGLNKASRRFLDDLHYGETTCIRLLRRACQSHRLDSGVFRIGSDPLRQGLMDGARNVLPVPAQFRHARFLQRLVESSILDGALLSSLEIDGLLPGRPQGPDPLGLGEPASGSVATPTLVTPPVATPRVDESSFCRNTAQEWDGCLLVPLGCWQLGMVVPAGVHELPHRWMEVLVPPLGCAPGLASAVRQQQWMVQQGPQDFNGSSRHQLLESQQLPCIATPSWFAGLGCCASGVRWLELASPIREQIWLLVNPSIWEQYPALAELAETIKASIDSFHA
jgi:DNA-binding transcriptional LysR family regulator